MKTYSDGSLIKIGDKISTWGNSTVYEIVSINGDLWLKDIKPLSYVNCVPVKIN